MRNRWYDPEGGRFVNEDPVGFAGGVNLYTFGGNDPVNGSDPSGLSPEDCHWVAAENTHSGGIGVLIIYGNGYWECFPSASGDDGYSSDPSTYSRRGGAGRTATKPSGPNSPACNAAAANFVVSFGADALGVSAVRGVKMLARASQLKATHRADLEAWRAWHFGGSLTPAPRPSNWSYLTALWGGSANLSVDLASKFSEMRGVLAAQDWGLERSLEIGKMVPILGSGLSLGEAVLACR